MTTLALIFSAFILVSFGLTLTFGAVWLCLFIAKEIRREWRRR